MSRFRLARDEQGYYLDDIFSRQKPLRANFIEPALLTRLGRAGKKSELVARAVRSESGLRVLDCTAGLARDSLILAYLGCQVTLCERSPVMQCLLADALERAQDHEMLGPAVSRMTLVPSDAISMLDSGIEHDVVYLDPMFPEKEGSAAVRGSMQYLQRFLGVDEDTDRLLETALYMHCDRVVLKRPAKGGTLHSELPEPIHVFKNRNSRFEVYSPIRKTGQS